MKNACLIPLLIFVFISCTKVQREESGFEVFLIKKGQHNSRSAFVSYDDSILKFDVVFDSTAIYNIVAHDDNEDVNKLFGMTDCGMANHMNSARIGWRWFQDSLQLFSYVYCNSVRTITYITSANIGEEVHCSITAKRGQYVFSVNSVLHNEKRICTGNDRYLQYPYFGGNRLAPHNISIKIAY